MPTGGENNNLLNTLLASAGGAIIVYVITRIFSKSEDSASKQYVDAKCEKLEVKIEKKADKDAFDRIDAKLDALYKLLIEQRGQSPQKYPRP